MHLRVLRSELFRIAWERICTRIRRLLVVVGRRRVCQRLQWFQKPQRPTRPNLHTLERTTTTMSEHTTITLA